MSTATAAGVSVIAWFEIPADDFERAVAFYETIFVTKLKRENMGSPMAVFPYTRPGVSGAIVDRPGNAGANGPILYLDVTGHLDEVLERIPAAGGRVILPKTPVAPDMGHFAHAIDTEGNRFAIHAM